MQRVVAWCRSAPTSVSASTKSVIVDGEVVELRTGMSKHHCNITRQSSSWKGQKITHKITVMMERRLIRCSWHQSQDIASRTDVILTELPSKYPQFPTSCWRGYHLVSASRARSCRRGKPPPLVLVDRVAIQVGVHSDCGPVVVLSLDPSASACDREVQSSILTPNK